MSEPANAATPEVLQGLAALCLRLYVQATPTGALYARAVEAAIARARSLLQAYLVEGTTQLRDALPPDDLGLLLRSVTELAQLAQMSQGLLVLSEADLRTIVERP